MERLEQVFLDGGQIQLDAVALAAHPAADALFLALFAFDPLRDAAEEQDDVRLFSRRQRRRIAVPRLRQ